MKFSRKRVSKFKSAHKFKRNARKTKMLNLRSTPMRGGWRF